MSINCIRCGSECECAKSSSELRIYGIFKRWGFSDYESSACAEELISLHFKLDDAIKTTFSSDFHRLHCNLSARLYYLEDDHPLKGPATIDDFRIENNEFVFTVFKENIEGGRDEKFIVIKEVNIH